MEFAGVKGMCRHCYPKSMRYLPILILMIPAFAADPWAQYRGPGSNGIAEDSRLPDKWSDTENVKWRADVPGVGWSSPIVWGGRIFLTSVISANEQEVPKKGLYFGGNREAPPTGEHRWMVYAFDFASGKKLWEREVKRGAPEMSRHLKNSFASETPATDGKLVYAYFGNLGLWAFDFSGKLVWKRDFPAHKTRYGWGTAASPVLHKGRLYIVNDNDEASTLMALDAANGKTIWEVARDEKSNWATPFVWENGERTEIVTPGTGKVRSYDPDGKVLWEFKGMSTIAIPTPFTRFGLLYVTSGYVGDENRPVYVIKPGAKGDITGNKEQLAWYKPQAGPYNPSPLVYGDLYYTLLDRGFLTAHEAKTGVEIYSKQRIDSEAGAFTSSPWAYNGKVFALSEDGDTFVFAAGREYKLLGKNSLKEMCMATPAIYDGSLLIRTAGRLYRIGK